MPITTPLPSSLPTVFTVCEALTRGVGRGRLRSSHLDGRVWGVRMPQRSSLRVRAEAALLGCGRDAFLCGPTAAVAHGMPVPWRLHPDRRRDELDIATPGPGRAVRRRGIRARSLRIRDGDVVSLGGVRAMSMARAWCDLTRWCSVPELVGVADWLIREADVAPDDLARSVRLFDRRGTGKLHAALALADPASESPKESELRALVRLSGLPPVRSNVRIARDGRTVARVDLLFEAYGEVLEYQGDHHRTDLRQWRRDRTRESELESLGYHVTEVTAADLADAAAARALLARIAENLRRRGWSGALRFSRWVP